MLLGQCYCRATKHFIKACDCHLVKAVYGLPPPRCCQVVIANQENRDLQKRLCLAHCPFLKAIIPLLAEISVVFLLFFHYWLLVNANFDFFLVSFFLVKTVNTIILLGITSKEDLQMISLHCLLTFYPFFNSTVNKIFKTSQMRLINPSCSNFSNLQAFIIDISYFSASDRTASHITVLKVAAT